MANPDHLQTACAIADRLCEDALWHDGRAVWLGDSREEIAGNWEVVHRSVDGDLYGGTAGIGLFLTRLWSVTGVQHYRTTAEGAFGHAVDWHRRARPTGSLYAGSGGVAAAIAEAARVFQSQELRRTAERLARDAIADLPESENDLIGGRSGSIIALLFLARELHMPEADAAAMALGRGLSRSATLENHIGAAWTSDIGADEPPLCGLAHGASGPAYALGELAASSGLQEFDHLADAALRYERSWFSREESNWPDLREITRGKLARGEPPQYPLYWCHGAPGIGLVRLRRYKQTGETVYAAEAGAALQAAEKNLSLLTKEPESVDASLCHGIASLVELFVEAYRVFNEHRFLELADRGAEFTDRISDHGATGWPCGVPEGGENPSLMVGLAGIGMMFLRVARPETAPVGLIYTREVPRQRLIVQLQGPLSPESLQSRAQELSRMIPGTVVERFSRRGRVLLRLPTSASATDAIEQLNQLDDVTYAEADIVDRATDS